jgi:beta-glucosidase/6-phospho-beta-glucosidase/beta-galactosidase
MKTIIYFVIVFAFLCNVAMLQAQVQKPALLSMVIPDGLGYNIHFTDARAGEMEMLAESGATIIRTDLPWKRTEREKGVYDFSAFDRLTGSLEKFKIRPFYVLDYSNKFYDNGQSPHTEEGRTAFAQWAAAAAVHFKDRGILWEIYNEPNLGFVEP